jgi:lysophospholipase L1-like esterase
MRFLGAFLLLSVSAPLFLPAQQPSASELRSVPNHVENAGRGLLHFFERLSLLEQGKLETLCIVHIGDSHIQADYLSGRMRNLMQTRFGNAGRGLVFPFRLAATNSPADISVVSPSVWEPSKLIQATGLPVGIAGLAIRSTQPGAWLRLSLRSDIWGSDARFDRVRVFFDPQGGAWAPDGAKPAEERPLGGQAGIQRVFHEVLPGESLGAIAARYQTPVERLRAMNRLSSSELQPGQQLIVRQSHVLTEEPPLAAESLPFFRTWEFDSALSTLTLRSAAAPATLYGLSLENSRQPGVIYHAIGINGARADHYTRAQGLLQQVQALRPDLVIVSLGANDTYTPYFKPEAFYKEIDLLLCALEQNLPHSEFLLTSPPDAYRNRRYPNPAIAEASEALRTYALNEDLAFWDFYRVMGGKGSVARWRSAGLVQEDYLHLTRAGYERQARLLFDALIEAYGNFLDQR